MRPTRSFLSGLCVCAISSVIVSSLIRLAVILTRMLAPGGTSGGSRQEASGSQTGAGATAADTIGANVGVSVLVVLCINLVNATLTPSDVAMMAAYVTGVLLASLLLLRNRFRSPHSCRLYARMCLVVCLRGWTTPRGWTLGLCGHGGWSLADGGVLLFPLRRQHGRDAADARGDEAASVAGEPRLS
jgi:hypothetical protein